MRRTATAVPNSIENVPFFDSFKVAKVLRKRLPNILTWFKHRISNSAGFNSRLQSIKSNARGFRKFHNYRTRILFFCGRLQLKNEIR